MAIGDVDGDGRADIVLIVHDRVVVLRQDPGNPAPSPASAASQARRQPLVPKSRADRLDDLADDRRLANDRLKRPR